MGALVIEMSSDVWQHENPAPIDALNFQRNEMTLTARIVDNLLACVFSRIDSYCVFQSGNVSHIVDVAPFAAEICLHVDGE